MEKITDEDIKNAIEILNKNTRVSDRVYLAYCEKHKQIHSTLSAKKGCFSNLKY